MDRGHQEHLNPTLISTERLGYNKICKIYKMYLNVVFTEDNVLFHRSSMVRFQSGFGCTV